ncbi:hypothetical protein [Tolypothrix sp. NIES-4075]|uniref:hypothetical protein n=1 Tax=Tolypothrix sp. NIES-4075 TaxID=2005459 RepID=UPI001F344C5C|nr:hypothetical protein [Tolypothrix sp. NIES-4075]
MGDKETRRQGDKENNFSFPPSPHLPIPPSPLPLPGIVEHEEFPEDTLNYRCYRGVV